MPDQTLVVGDSETFSIIIFLDRSIDSLVYAEIHCRLTVFYVAAITTECEEEGRETFKLLGSLAAFLEDITHKWRIYAFGNLMWPFIWQALTTCRLTDSTRSWTDREEAGRKILLRLLYDVHFFQWKWTRSKFPLPRLVASPRARQFLRFLANYDASDDEKSLHAIGLKNTILYDVRAAKLRIRQEKGETIVSELVEAEKWELQSQGAQSASSVKSKCQDRNKVSHLSDEAEEEDDHSFVQIKPSELPTQDQSQAGSHNPSKSNLTSRTSAAKTSTQGPPINGTPKPSQVRVEIPPPVASKRPAMKADLDTLLYKKFQQETGFYPPPSRDVLNDSSDYTKDLRSVAAKYFFADPNMNRVVKEKVDSDVYSLLVLFKGYPQRYKGFDKGRLPNIVKQFQNWEIIPVERESKCMPCTFRRTSCHRQNSTDTNKSSCRQCRLGKTACNPPAPPTSNAPPKSTATDSNSTQTLNGKHPQDDLSNEDGGSLKRQKISASNKVDLPHIKTLDIDEEDIEIESE